MNKLNESLAIGDSNTGNNIVYTQTLNVTVKNVKQRTRKKELIGEQEYLYVIDKQGQYIDFLLKLIKKWKNKL